MEENAYATFIDIEDEIIYKWKENRAACIRW